MQTPADTPQTPPPGFARKAKASLCACPKSVDGMWLFDIQADPSECTNLAGDAAHSDDLKSVLATYDAYKATAVPDLALAYGTDDPQSNPLKRPDKAWGPFPDSSMCKYV